MCKMYTRSVQKGGTMPGEGGTTGSWEGASRSQVEKRQRLHSFAFLISLSKRGNLIQIYLISREVTLNKMGGRFTLSSSQLDFSLQLSDLGAPRLIFISHLCGQHLKLDQNSIFQEQRLFQHFLVVLILSLLDPVILPGMGWFGLQFTKQTTKIYRSMSKPLEGQHSLQRIKCQHVEV